MHIPTLSLGLLSFAVGAAYAQPGWVISQATQNVPGRGSAAPATAAEVSSSPTVSDPTPSVGSETGSGGGGSSSGGSSSSGGGSSKKSSGHSHPHSSAGAGKAPGGKMPPPIMAAPEPFQLSLSAGWNSKYEFKHVDQIDAGNEFGKRDSDSIWQIKADAQYQEFGFSASLIQSLDTHHQRYGAVDANGKANHSKEYYQEVIFGVNYTTQIAPDLDASVGYIATVFPNSDFWGGTYQGEAQVRLRYKGIAHLQPSIAYSNIHGDVVFVGNWYEARIDSPWVLYQNGETEVGVNLSAEVAYDGKYNNNDNGWAGFVLRAALPIKLNASTVLTLSGNYGWDLEDNAGHSDFDNLGFWGGAAISYRF